MTVNVEFTRGQSHHDSHGGKGGAMVVDQASIKGSVNELRCVSCLVTNYLV